MSSSQRFVPLSSHGVFLTTITTDLPIGKIYIYGYIYKFMDERRSKSFQAFILLLETVKVGGAVVGRV